VTIDTAGFTAPDNASTTQQNVTIPASNPLAISNGTRIASVNVYLDPEALTDWRGTGQPYPLKPGEIARNVTPVPGATLFDVYSGAVTAEQFVAGLTEEQLGNLMVASNSSGATTPFGRGAAGYLRQAEALGIPALGFADGPSGLNLSASFNLTVNGATVRQYQRVVAYPSGTNMAQTFNSRLMEEVGKAIGEEMHDNGAALWLAPGANIHRDPLCGRNVEYYSEDPLLSGLSGAWVTRGLQTVPGVGAAVKHFAANNQEAEREGSNSVINERALREIYLRSFEIVVKVAQPMSVMSSYNKINGHYTATDWDLLQDILRQEWGFAGMIMTDWGGARSGPMNNAYAGNDVLSPGTAGNTVALMRTLVPYQPIWDANGLPTQAGMEQYGANPGYRSYSLNLGNIVPRSPSDGGTLVESHVSTGNINTAQTAIDNWVAAAERADAWSGVPRDSIQLTPLDGGGYRVDIYGWKGLAARLGDVQACALRILGLTAQTQSFGQLAEIKGIAGVEIPSYLDQFGQLEDFLTAGDPADSTSRAILDVAIATYESYEPFEADYTPESWAPLAQALATARELAAAAHPSEFEIAAVLAALDAAVDGLEPATDASALRALIDYADWVVANSDQFLSANVPNLVAAITQARTVLGQPDATQAQLTAAALALFDVIATVLPKGDKTLLNKLIQFADGLDSARYTPASWAPVAAALTAARTVAAAAEAAQTELEDAYNALRDATTALVLKASKAGLQSAIAVAEAILAAADQYSPSSLAGLPEALTAARAVNANANATAAQVADAQAALVAEISEARRKASTLSLASALAAAASIEAPTAALKAAVGAAEAVLADPEATQADVDAAQAAIAAALGASAGQLALTAAVRVSGTARVGVKLSAGIVHWNAPGVTTAYQWLRGGKAIEGATAPAYTLKAADKGKRVSLRVTGAAAGLGRASAVTAATAKVKAGVLKASKPKIKGSAAVGAKLKATLRVLKPKASAKYVWYADGKVVAKSAKPTYKVTADDAGKKISVKVTLTRAGYQKAAIRSARTAAVTW
jgi:beta-glucosidase-like glycosyl hydrolase